MGNRMRLLVNLLALAQGLRVEDGGEWGKDDCTGADKWTHTDKDGKINILAPTTAETEGDYKLSGNVIKIEPDTTTNPKTQRQIRKHNSKRANTTTNQKTQRQIRKHNSKRENTTAKEKTQQQKRKHNGKSENTTAKEKHGGKRGKKREKKKNTTAN